jgi:hypothetical protein
MLLLPQMDRPLSGPSFSRGARDIEPLAP